MVNFQMSTNKHWGITGGSPRRLVKVDTQSINKYAFDKWLQDKGVNVIDEWFEGPWALYRVLSGQVNYPMMEKAWGGGLQAGDVEKPGEPPPEYAGGPAALEEQPEGEPIPQTTMEYWLKFLYTKREAATIAKWVKDNQMSPSPLRISAILMFQDKPKRTARAKAWDDFRYNPDIFKAISLIPSAVAESFSRVFNGYSFIDEKPAAPRPGDYIGVGSIIAGLSLGAIGAVMALIPAAPAAQLAVSNALVKSGSVDAGVKITAAASKVPFTSAFATTAEKAVGGLVVKPVLAKSIAGWATSPAGLKTMLGGAVGLLGADTFIDFIGEESVQTAGMGVWTLISAKDWEGADIALDKYKVFIGHLKAKVDMIGPLNPLSYGAFKNYYEAAQAQAASYEKVIDANLGVLPEDFPEIIKATVRDIIDGDTIDVSLEATNQETGKVIELPEYSTTGHARIRLVGINSPEKSPKGEILCSDVEIFKVENKYTDMSRDRLLPLNDKEVTLKVDPKNALGTYGRILALVEFEGTNINLRQIKEGLACGYYRGENKYVDNDLYKKETLAAKAEGIGMWKEAAVAEEFGPGFSIKIDSVPSNAKLFIDGTSAHHNTPADETELADVMEMLVPGEHVIKATKAGKEASQKVTIVKGPNTDIMLTLKTVGLEPGEPEGEEEAAGNGAPEIPEEFKINIDSTPSNAKLFIDEVYTHHMTPSNEKELEDVMHMLTPGKHSIILARSGKSAEKEVDIVPGDNGVIAMVLEVVGLLRSKEDIEKELETARALLEKLEAELAKT